MLVLHTRTGEIRETPTGLGDVALPPDIVWIDALTPSLSEAAFVERATGLHLPTFAALRDRKSTRLNSSHIQKSRMPSSA